MSASSLRIEELRVRGAPGIEEQYDIVQIGPGVNLIHGPNGSGKSTTARAIEASLWPREADPVLSVRVRYAMNGGAYTVNLDRGAAVATHDGKPCDLPDFPHADFRERYHLALHDLLGRDDEAFAARIAHESAGGIDVSSAFEALGFRDRPRGSGQATKELADAEAHERECRRSQQELESRYREVDALEERRREASEAAVRAGCLEKALFHAQARDAEAAAAAVLAGFDGRLKAVAGDEFTRLRELRRQSAGCATTIENLEAERRGAAARASTLFPTGAPQGERLPACRAALDRLRECERELRSATARREEAAAQEIRALKPLGSHATEARLSSITADSFEEVLGVARAVEALAARRAALDTELARAGAAIPSIDVDGLREGRIALVRWLRAPAEERDAASRVVPVSIAAVVVAIAAILAFRVHPAFWGLGLVGVALALGLAFRRRGSDPRQAAQRDYEQLRLERPASWSVGEVSARLDSILKAIADAEVVRARADWRSEVEARIARLGADTDDVRRRVNQVAATHGVAPDAELRTLAAIVHDLALWKEARGERAAADEALAVARVELDRGCALLTELLRPFGYTATTDSALTAGCVEDLATRAAAHDEALGAVEKAGLRIDQEQRESERLGGEISAIFARLTLPPDDDRAVERFCSEQPAFTEARVALDEAASVAAARTRDLQGAAGYDERLLVARGAEIDRELESARAAAAGHEALVRQIDLVRYEVGEAERGSALTEAVAATAAARERLVSERAADLEAMVGGVLLRHVEQEVRRNQLPPVFLAARKNFAEITSGRYELRLDRDDGAAFTAYDTVERVERTLDQLSSATKLQLLLSTRLAFVESQESGTRLPLLLDETLSTSDALRARAIVDAVAMLARQGRQVFYFTAQRDEEAKWVSALAELDVPFRSIDLAAVRGRREVSAPPALPSAAAIDVPPPGAMSHEEYGALLHVEPIDVGRDAVERTPVWYLFDSTVTVHRLLRFGFRRWGQLASFVEGVGMGAICSANELRRAKGLARMVDALHRAAAVGRGKPVDRGVLADSGAVSDRYLDSITGIAESAGGDAARLLAALDGAARPRGFGAAKIEELADFLRDNGYVDDAAPLSLEEIPVAVLRDVAEEVDGGTLEPSDLDEIMARVRSRSAASAMARA